MQHPDVTYLALANLVGGWKENNDADIAVTREMLGIEYETWLHKAREILHCPDSPLSLKNGHWRISSRQELNSSVG